MDERKENNKLDESDVENEKEGEMQKRRPATYYRTRREAENKRKKGQRVYREAGQGYYIRQPKPKEKTFLEKIFGY